MSAAIQVLLDRGILAHRDPYMTKKPGRPLEYLDLKSPCVIRDICDELKYRKEHCEIEMKELESRLNYEMWAECSEIGNDISKRNKFVDKYNKLAGERLNLGAANGSFSLRAVKDDAQGKHAWVVQEYDGTDNALKEISYQGIKYWLRLLQHPVRRILSFLIDDELAIFSKSEIERGACLYTYSDAFLHADGLSKILSKLEAGAIITATQVDHEKKYRLNIANLETKELIVGLCLWQKKNAIAAGIRGRTIERYVDNNTIKTVLREDIARQNQELKNRLHIKTLVSQGMIEC